MGKLYFKYGVMGACKTAEALMAKFRYEEIGQHCLFCKTKADTRDGERTVKSRIGLVAEGVLFLEEVLKITDFSGYDVIIVDEAQFATKEQIDALGVICDDEDIPVICYGLKSDFQGNFFEGSKRLFEIADKLEEIKQICWCGRKALFNARVVNGTVAREGEQLMVGGDDKYVALCRKHYRSGKISRDSHGHLQTVDLQQKTVVLQDRNIYTNPFSWKYQYECSGSVSFDNGKQVFVKFLSSEDGVKKVVIRLSENGNVLAEEIHDGLCSRWSYADGNTLYQLDIESEFSLDIPIVLYHGSNAFEEISVFKRGKTGILGPGRYFTSDYRVAKQYATKDIGNDKGRVYKVLLSLKNPLVVTSENPALEILGERKFRNREKANGNRAFWINPQDIASIRNMGYDSIVWKYAGTTEVNVLKTSCIQILDSDEVSVEEV